LPLSVCWRNEARDTRRGAIAIVRYTSLSVRCNDSRSLSHSSALTRYVIERYVIAADVASSNRKREKIGDFIFADGSSRLMIVIDRHAELDEDGKSTRCTSPIEKSITSRTDRRIDRYDYSADPSQMKFHATTRLPADKFRDFIRNKSLDNVARSSRTWMNFFLLFICVILIA